MTGSAKPVTIVEASELSIGGGARLMRGGAALRIIDVTDQDVPLEGGTMMSVYVVAEADASFNGGVIPVAGNTPIPVKKVSGRKISGGHVLPIYPVLADGTYDSDFTDGVVIPSYLLLESGDYLLMESDDKFLLEDGTLDTNPPMAPSGLSAEIDGEDSLLLSWIDNSNNESGFDVERALTIPNWQKIVTEITDAQSYKDRNLEIDTTYHYQVKALGVAGNSSYSSSASNSIPTLSLSGISRSVIVTGTVGGGDWHGRPSVVKLADDTIVMVYVTSSGHNSKDEQIHIRFSDDYGATWTDEDEDLDSNPVTGFPAYPPNAAPADPESPIEGRIMLADNGNLLMTTWRREFGVTNDGTWIISSSNNGSTWGAWSKIDFSGTTRDDHIFMTNDYILFGGNLYLTGREDQGVDGDVVKTIIAKSEDDGATWQKLAEIGNYEQFAIEAGAVYQADGEIVAILRSYDAIHTYRSISEDYGATWSFPEEVSEELIRTGRPIIYTDAFLKDEVNWEDDKILIMCGFTHVTEESQTPRQNTIWVSRDGGNTWSDAMYPGAQYGDAGYGDLFYDPINSKHVLVTYEGSSTAADLVQYKFSIDNL